MPSGCIPGQQLARPCRSIIDGPYAVTIVSLLSVVVTVHEYDHEQTGRTSARAGGRYAPVTRSFTGQAIRALTHSRAGRGIQR